MDLFCGAKPAFVLGFDDDAQISGELGGDGGQNISGMNVVDGTEQLITLVLYIWITLICWLVWLSLSFVSLFTMRDLVGYRRLLACWPGSSSFFDLLSLDKSSSVLLFLIGRLVGNFCLFFA